MSASLPPRRPFVIDTDMAIDDWMAMLYLAAHPAVDLRAVTIAATGEAHAGPGARNALKLLEFTGCPGVPVSPGRETPLQGSTAFPWAVRFTMDAMLWLRLPGPKATPDPRPAVSLLAEILLGSPAPVTIVALGPLTNLAELFAQRPETLAHVERIVSMGGALDVPGNITDITPRSPNLHAEWNYYCDPTAAARVFRSGAPITLIPLDITNQVPVTPAFLQTAEKQCSTPAGSFLVRLLRRVAFMLKQRGFYAWDPLAAVAAVRPDLVETETRRLRVIEDPGPEAGRVVAHPSGSPVEVALRVDPRAFEQEYLAYL